MNKRTSADPNCTLFEWGTYAKTTRLNDIIEGKKGLGLDDVINLWHVFAEGNEEAVGNWDFTLRDFTDWLAGTGPFEGNQCEVVW